MLKLTKCIKESSVVKIHQREPSYLANYFETDIKDPYFRAFIKRLPVDHSSFNTQNLEDIFIEFFLRQDNDLKNLKIEQTNYGLYLKEELEKNEE